MIHESSLPFTRFRAVFESGLDFVFSTNSLSVALTKALELGPKNSMGSARGF
jgi:hypothetical protein